MGGACCKCYTEPKSSETKIEESINNNSSKPPMHDMQNMQSVPSISTNPALSKETEGSKSKISRSNPTRQRLVEFYKKHNPTQVGDHERIDEICRRYSGREDQLFADLSRKYTLTSPTIPESSDRVSPLRNPNSGEDAPESPETDPEDHPMLQDRDHSESVPLTGSKHPIPSTTTPVKISIVPDSAAKKKDKVHKPGKDLFKIEVTKPNANKLKKKAMGTSLFGSSILGGDTPKGKQSNRSSRSEAGKKLRDVPALNNAASNSVSRSTSFIDGKRSSGLGTPVPHFSAIGRSNTLTLDSSHKANLDKRRQSSLAVRGKQNQRNLPIRINKAWARFAQYVIDKMLEDKQLLDAEKADAKAAKRASKQAPIETKTEETEDILDSIINGDKGGNKTFTEDVVRSASASPQKNKLSHPAGGKSIQGSMEILAIDPRLFEEAKKRESVSSYASSSSSSDSAPDDDIVDVYSIELSYSQFNIVLNNSGVEIKPDMAAALVWTLLDTNKMIADDLKTMGLEDDNFHNDPMKERGFHSKQFKLIYKCKLTYTMIETLMTRLNGGGLVSRNDRSLHPKHLTYVTRNYIIWDKIMDHLINKTAFNVESDYLYGALSEEELADGDKICDMIGSLDSHWQHRVQLMEHIDDKLNSASEMERDIFFASILSDNENYLKILKGWAIQLTDDRSGVARTAVTSLPTVLSGMLLCIQYPGLLFDKEEIIEPVYGGIFTLVKNRRLKDMADDAYDTMMAVTDVLAELGREEYGLLSVIVELLSTHTNPKVEKHDKAREGCVGGIAFLLYGVEQEPDRDDSGEEPKVSEEKEEKEKVEGKRDECDVLLCSSAKSEMKISKSMQRKYLLDNEEFVKALGECIKNGVTDKSESARKKAFSVIQKLEKEEDGELVKRLLEGWDYIIQKKYGNFKKMEERRKTGGKKPRNSRGRSSTRTKGKRKKSALKNRVKKMKSVDTGLKDKIEADKEDDRPRGDTLTVKADVAEE